MKKIVLSTILFSAVVLSTATVGSAHEIQRLDGKITSNSRSNSIATDISDIWKAITNLFDNDPHFLAEGVTQETIDHVKELVEKNITSAGLKEAMLATVQDAQ